MKKPILYFILAILLIVSLILSGCTAEDPGYSILVDTDLGPITIDDATDAITTIDYAHYGVHSGSSYVVKSWSDRANNEVVDAQITTPNTLEWVHMFANFSTESEFMYYIYEGATINVVGVAQTPRNRDRNQADVSVLTVAVIENATVALANADTPVAGATLIFEGVTGAGRKIGGGERAEEEFILKQNTIYCLRLVANAAGWADFEINYYEHTSLKE